jgi:hypothetical protein
MKKLLLGFGMALLLSTQALACECEPVWGLINRLPNRITDASNMGRQQPANPTSSSESKDVTAAKSDQATVVTPTPAASAPQK